MLQVEQDPQSLLGLAALESARPESRLDGDQIVATIIKLEKEVVQAEAEGLLNPLAASQAEFKRFARNKKAPYAASRNATIRRRLHLLGYTADTSDSGTVDRQMTAAIRRFQQEVQAEVDSSFIVDGWAGEQTWTALDELTSFESGANSGRWARNGWNKPLQRAAALRLFTLGLLEELHFPTSPAANLEEAGTSTESLNEALRTFTVVARLLDLQQGLPEKPCPATMNALFDQEGIVRCLAASKNLTVTSAKYRPVVNTFVVRAASVELWLLGYDVVPTYQEAHDPYLLEKNVPADKKQAIYEARREAEGKRQFLTPKGFENLRTAGAFKPYYAIRQFCEDAGYAAEVSSRHSGSLAAALSFCARYKESIQPGLFQVLQLINSEAEEPVLDEAGFRQLLIELDHDPHGHSRAPTRSAIMKRISEIGSRFWDGVQRTWRWIGLQIGRGLQKIGDWMRDVVLKGDLKRGKRHWLVNLARVIFDHAQRAFTIVARAVSKLQTSVSYLLARMEKKWVGNPTIHIQSDLDSFIFIPTGGGKAAVQTAIKEMGKQATIYDLGMRIMGILVRAGMDIAALVSGWGWLAFFMILMRSLRNLVALPRLTSKIAHM